MVFEKNYERLLIPNCTRKIMGLLFNNIHEKNCQIALKSLWWGVNTRKLRAKINYSNAANIITREVKTTFCTLQKRAEQFMALFNVFELKILGYYLKFSAPPENFFFLLWYFASFVWALTTASQAKLSRTMDTVQPLFLKCLSNDAIITLRLSGS